MADQQQFDALVLQVQTLMDQRVTDRADITAARQQVDDLTGDLQTTQQDLQDTQQALQVAQDAVANGPGALAAALQGLALGVGAGAGAAAAGAGVAGAAALGAAAPVGGPPGPGRTKPLPRFYFEGKADEDWLSFRDIFRNYGRFQNYTPEEAKNALNLCMRGTAQRAVSGIDHANPAITYANLIDLYEAKFLPAAASALARTQYDEARQGPKEPILTYHGRLQTLLLRAYPAQDVDAPMIVRKFVTGLASNRVRQQVLRTNPLNYTDALNAAQAEQAVLEQGRVNPQVDVTYGGDGLGGRDIRALEIQAFEVRTGTCHNCQKPGHYARECRAPVQEKPAESGWRARPPQKAPNADHPRSKPPNRRPEGFKKPFGGTTRRKLNEFGDPDPEASSADEQEKDGPGDRSGERPEDTEGSDSQDQEEAVDF